MKKAPTPSERRGKQDFKPTNESDSAKPLMNMQDDLPDGFFIDESGQITFVEPCTECEPLALPSLSSREGHILLDLIRGSWLSNESIYRLHGGHDGRKALSLLRREYGIRLEWKPVTDGGRERKHRIIPKCLPIIKTAVNRRL
jgi:hypothetical protein